MNLITTVLYCVLLGVAPVTKPSNENVLSVIPLDSNDKNLPEVLIIINPSESGKEVGFNLDLKQPTFLRIHVLPAPKIEWQTKPMCPPLPPVPDLNLFPKPLKSCPCPGQYQKPTLKKKPYNVNRCPSCPCGPNCPCGQNCPCNPMNNIFDPEQTTRKKGVC